MERIGEVESRCTLRLGGKLGLFSWVRFKLASTPQPETEKKSAAEKKRRGTSLSDCETGWD